jgi:hypothetical protein
MCGDRRIVDLVEKTLEVKVSKSFGHDFQTSTTELFCQILHEERLLDSEYVCSSCYQVLDRINKLRKVAQRSNHVIHKHTKDPAKITQQELYVDCEPFVPRSSNLQVQETSSPYYNGYETYQSTVYRDPESTFTAPELSSMFLSGSGDSAITPIFHPGFVSTQNEFFEPTCTSTNDFHAEIFRDYRRPEPFDWADATEESRDSKSPERENIEQDDDTLYNLTATKSMDSIDLPHYQRMRSFNSIPSTIEGSSPSSSDDEVEHYASEEEYVCGICFNCDADQHK